MNRDVIWRSLQTPGFEHVMIREMNGVIVVNGVTVGITEKVPFRLHYVLRCDPAFATKSLELSLIAPMKKWMSLPMEEMNTWIGGAGLQVEEIKDCVDVAISASPFTHTLPVNRLKLSPGQAKEITVINIHVPEFKLSIAKHRYARKDDSEGKQLYFFEDLTTNTSCDLVIDNEGLVVKHSDRYERLW